MAVPTAAATSIRYKGVDYAYGVDSIEFTELNPTITVTFDNNDWTSWRYVAQFTPPLNNPAYHYIQEANVGTLVDSFTVTITPRLKTQTTTFLVYVGNVDGWAGSGVQPFTINLATGANDSWQKITRQVIRDTLIANLDAGSLATITEDSTIKIFWEDADEKWQQPFILTQTITGGDLNSASAYAEMLWRVVIHTPSLATAGAMENAIHNALARQTPVINFSDVCEAGHIEEVTPVTDRYQVQQKPLFVSGGIYRIRLTKG
jgi:hypothetical protein